MAVIPKKMSATDRQLLMLFITFLNSGNVKMSLVADPSLECGRSNIVITNAKRIAGGHEADETKFPWQVRLRLLADNRCNGILIHARWILTAASCFKGNYNVNLWSVELSAFTTSDGLKVPRVSVFIDAFYLHGAYREGDGHHDLAVVRLSQNKFSHLYQPICVINASDDVNNNQCLVVGWGAKGVNQGPSSYLQQIHIPVRNHTTCSLLYNQSVLEENLCAPFRSPNFGPCTGDTGAPLICKFGNMWKVTGVVSENFGCQGNIENPAIFVNLQYFLSFVQKIMSMYKDDDVITSISPIG